jgi:peptide-methionine (S)-S-oxide reductase
VARGPQGAHLSASSDRARRRVYRAALQVAIFANGCFWGSEKGAWRLPGGGIITTAVGYVAGKTRNPLYQEVCSGMTGHTEAVQVVYDPAKVSFVDLLRWFWQSHDPCSGMGQGNDRGTQYRSGFYYFDGEQKALIEARAAAAAAVAAAAAARAVLQRARAERSGGRRLIAWSRGAGECCAERQ